MVGALLAGALFLGPAGAVTQVANHEPQVSAGSGGFSATSLGLVTSTAERLTNISIGRDGGYSVPVDSRQSFWLFGDTVVRTLDPVSKVLMFSPGSSAAIGPTSQTQLPTNLREVIPNVGIAPVLNKPTMPAFLPMPKATYLRGRKDLCSPAAGRFSARWPTGTTRLGTSANIIISYVDVWVEGAQTTVEGFGVAAWSSKTFKYVLAPVDLATPTSPGKQINLATIWASPISAPDGSVDFFSVTDDTTQLGASVVRTAHVAKGASLSRLSNYVSRKLRGPLNGSFPGRLLHFAAYPGSTSTSVTYRAIGAQFSLGTATVSSTNSLTGTWNDEGSAALPGCPRPLGIYCWSLIGHPEMSTSTSIVVSYYAPGTIRDYGHIRLARLSPSPVTPPSTTTTTTVPA